KSELVGFGVTSDGQLGIRSTSGEHTFVSVPEHIVGAPCGHDGCTVVEIAAGEKHTLMLADDGKLWSVGGNESGQLGRGECSQGSYTIYPVPVSTTTKFVQISVGRSHSAAITEDGRLFMWGSNEQGQCGVRGKNVYERPKRVQELNEVILVACGPDHTTVLTESGRIFTFGLQYDGACLHEPVEMKEFLGMPIASVHAGGRHWAALTSSGTVVVWGKNDMGQLGTGDTMFRAKPVVLASLSEMKVVDIALGDSHSLFLTQDGRVFACGGDNFGQIGMGNRTEINSTPKVILELMGSHVTRIAAGRIHSMVTVGGRIFSFGLNSNGQLGQGNTRSMLTPRPIDSLDHVARLFAGWDQSFVLRAAGVASLTSGASVARRPIRSLQWTNGEEMLKDKMEMIGQLESVFSSLSSINASFLHKDDRRFSISSSNHGVSLDDTMEFFNAIADASVADKKTYMDLCLDTLDMSLFSGEIRPRHYMHPECLRVFLIVPWLDVFVHPTVETVKTLHIKLCALLADVKEDHMDCLNQWWLDVPVRHFRRLVVGLVAGLQVLVNDAKWEVHAISLEILLSTLSLLHSLNGASNRIAHDTFYIHNLAEKVDIQKDYVSWVQSDALRKQSAFFWMKYPFIMNGVAKGQLLNVDSKIQQQAATMSTNQIVSFLGMNLLVGEPFFSIEIRRDHILEDTLNGLLNEHPEKMRKPMRVTFKDEEAEDRGGVRKEFFMILFEKLLNPDFGMFAENVESKLSWFSGVPVDEQSFNLVGMLTALAIYNEILVPFPFPLGMYKVFLRRELTLEDLTELSPTEGRGLQTLLDYEGSDVEEVFCLNFTISFSLFGATITEPLKKGGEDIAVTASNKQEYVNLYVQKRMAEGQDGEVGRQAQYFCNGFFSIVRDRVVSLFQPREFMELVVGNENYDWDLFKKNMQYKGVYHAHHPTIVAFWDAFFALTVDERKAFLQFLSGTYRLPLAGFSNFQSAIQPTASHLLPVAHTCFNLLDLPDLADKEELLRRLRVSIQQPTGFSLV
ncbi:hypothetical protein PFISCL1PPCAC_18840, partial [Pristionchus fissidentatus]